MSLRFDHDSVQTCPYDTREELLAALQGGDFPVEVLVFDECRRHYASDQGGPVHRAHFRVARVVGTTRVSYVLENGGKVPKRDPRGLYSNLDADRSSWCRENAYKTFREVERWAMDRWAPDGYERLVALAKVAGVELPEVKRWTR